MRWAGGARCVAIATGLRVGRGAERGGSLLFPPGPRAEAHRVAADVLRTAVPLTAPLTPHGPRARRRRYTRALAGGVAIVAAVVVRRRGRRLAHLGVGGLGRDLRRPRPSPPTAPAASAMP